MIDGVYAVGVGIWGALLGGLYFGGLWLTVRRLTVVKHQALWLLGSLVIRNVLAVAGFFPAVSLGWQYALICLAGFILARFIWVRRITPSPRRDEPHETG
ncbi:MAG: ATP synthase subunit I [Methylobacter sp.]|nr:ATP synthase subunit I [Methylobacter sp.]MDP2099067.1 ATP synthase subunit I [Methylobacter sp.]MDP2429476.1 ATP synthase subunit I [Methylobacter sp.]MDP3055482.1 ATP synthase subunit I [Methylobacter sp.]MDP3361862.1 ATP synthase subunit I [Methylobacter sp.]